jgi:hypothetical protein
MAVEPKVVAMQMPISDMIARDDIAFGGMHRTVVTAHYTGSGNEPVGARQE